MGLTDSISAINNSFKTHSTGLEITGWGTKSQDTAAAKINPARMNIHTGYVQQFAGGFIPMTGNNIPNN